MYLFILFQCFTFFFLSPSYNDYQVHSYHLLDIHVLGTVAGLYPAAELGTPSYSPSLPLYLLGFHFQDGTVHQIPRTPTFCWLLLGKLCTTPSVLIEPTSNLERILAYCSHLLPLLGCWKILVYSFSSPTGCCWWILYHTSLCHSAIKVMAKYLLLILSVTSVIACSTVDLCATLCFRLTGMFHLGSLSSGLHSLILAYLVPSLGLFSFY